MMTIMRESARAGRHRKCRRVRLALALIRPEPIAGRVRRFLAGRGSCCLANLALEPRGARGGRRGRRAADELPCSSTGGRPATGRSDAGPVRAERWCMRLRSCSAGDRAFPRPPRVCTRVASMSTDIRRASAAQRPGSDSVVARRCMKLRLVATPAGTSRTSFMFNASAYGMSAVHARFSRSSAFIDQSQPGSGGRPSSFKNVLCLALATRISVSI